MKKRAAAIEEIPGESSEPAIDARNLITLRAAPEFGGLDSDVIAALAQVFEEKLYPRGTQLARRGKRVDSLSFILDGKVVIDRPTSRTIDHGPIGLAELFGRDPGGLDARTQTDVRTLTAPASAIDDILEENVGFLLGALEGLARGNLALISRSTDASWLQPPFEHPEDVPERPLRLAERIIWLHSVLYFATSRVEAVAEMARVSTEERWAQGSVLWQSGDDPAGFLLLVSGEVACEGPFGTVTARAGQVLGAAEAMAGEQHWYRATAATPVRGLLTSRDAVLDVIEDQTDLGVDLVRTLALRFITLRDGAHRS